jgi:hypothetical protein
LYKNDLWSKEAWEDILTRKKKYREFCNLIGKAPLQFDPESYKKDQNREEYQEEGEYEEENGGEGEGYEQNREISVENPSETNTLDNREQ